MGYIGPRPPIIGETQEEALKRDIEYYERHTMNYKQMGAIIIVVACVFLIVWGISLLW